MHCNRLMDGSRSSAHENGIEWNGICFGFGFAAHQNPSLFPNRKISFSISPAVPNPLFDRFNKCIFEFESFHLAATERALRPKFHQMENENQGKRPSDEEQSNCFVFPPKPEECRCCCFFVNFDFCYSVFIEQKEGDDDIMIERGRWTHESNETESNEAKPKTNNSTVKRGRNRDREREKERKIVEAMTMKFLLRFRTTLAERSQSTASWSLVHRSSFVLFMRIFAVLLLILELCDVCVDNLLIVSQNENEPNEYRNKKKRRTKHTKTICASVLTTPNGKYFSAIQFFIVWCFFLPSLRRMANDEQNETKNPNNFDFRPNECYFGVQWLTGIDGNLNACSTSDRCRRQRRPTTLRKKKTKQKSIAMQWTSCRLTIWECETKRTKAKSAREKKRQNPTKTLLH